MKAEFENLILPAALTETFEFAQLSKEEVKIFRSRFSYIGEIVSDVENWLETRQGGFKSFLDGLELDLSVNQNLPGTQNDRQTSHLIHSSWTFDTPVAELRRQIPSEIDGVFKIPLPSMDCPLREFEYWLAQNVAALTQSAALFSKARTLAQALSSYMVIDIVLATMLAGCYRARFNSHLLQQAGE